ncbi:hypothetical protein FS749_010976, partial [Ceratobasidium sp. UAMH 11750]
KIDDETGAELEEAIHELFRDGVPDTQAATLLTEGKKYDTEQYHLRSLAHLRESLGLFSVRKQAWTVETAHPILAEARKKHPNDGIRQLHRRIPHECGPRAIMIPRSIIYKWMQLNEPEKLQERKGRMMQRRQFWCAGPNDVWAVDQHNKWKRFTFWLHVGLDAYSGMILWLKVYWTNSNPRLICKYYLDAIENVGGMPLTTCSDPGSENFGIANAQSTLRQMQDPSLRGTMQHKWQRKHSNIKPEIWWSQFRKRYAPELKALMQVGLDNEWYNPHITIEM